MNKPTEFDPEELERLARGPERPETGIAPLALVTVSKDGKRSRIVDSLAAEIVAKALRERVSWCPESATWSLWAKTHWQAQASHAPAIKLIADAVAVGCDDYGFRAAYLSGVVSLIQSRDLLPRPPVPRDVVPFLNGLLSLTDNTLHPATPEYAANYVLPHRYVPGAQCPTIRAWLSRTVEDDPATVAVLRAWLAALLRGMSIQAFLMLVGRGGSGKGVLSRLAEALVGSLNMVVSTLSQLEQNRFETANFHGKRLALFDEIGGYRGTVNQFKSLTGGTALRLERKNTQQSGSFVFDGLVLLTSNESLQASDPTSGLDRRRITIRFPRSATPKERAEWERQGGEREVLHRELPGLINWCLELSADEIRSTLRDLPASVTRENLLGMATGSSITDFLLEWCAPGPVDEIETFVTQVGSKDTSPETTLYGAYLRFADISNRRPVALRSFAERLVETVETLGYQVTRSHHPKHRYAAVYGLRLLPRDILTGEPIARFDWLSRITAPQVNPDASVTI